MPAEVVSRFDIFYRRLLITKFFTKGWGAPDNMRRLLEFRKILSCRKTCINLVDKDHPVHIDQSVKSSDCWLIDGHFLSPFEQQLPGIMPEEAKTARFQMVLPLKWTRKEKPMCINLAGTGDHGYYRRRFMARHLVKDAQIGSIILENPYYGSRKPKEQTRSSLANVSDLFVMGGALVLESITLLNWCKRNGFGPLGITGISMGGHMASLAASSWHEPLSFVPCLSWSTASMVWTQGVLSGAVSWDELQDQYCKDPQLYEDELAPLINSPEQHRWQQLFAMGQRFAQDYPDSVDEMERLQRESKEQAPALPFIGSVVNQITSILSDPVIEENKQRLKQLDLHSPNLPNKPIQAEVLHFMRGVMDECTHLSHFEPPVDPSLTIAVAAKQDAYMPRDRVLSLSDLWPGCEIRYINQGHVSAFLFKQSVFRQAIIDSFERQIAKYPSNSSDEPAVTDTKVNLTA